MTIEIEPHSGAERPSEVRRRRQPGSHTFYRNQARKRGSYALLPVMKREKAIYSKYDVSG